MLARVLQTLSGPPHTHREQVARYLLVGASGYGVAMALYALELAIGISPFAAVPPIFVVNGAWNFVLNRRWSFLPSGRHVTGELWRFCAVAAGSLLVNYAAFYVLHESLDIAAFPAQAVAILVATPVGFLGNKRWSFDARQAEPA